METDMDKLLSVLTLLTLVVCLNDGVAAFSVVGYCGGSVSIKCEYDAKYGSKTKYFCQGEQGNCKELIRTNNKNKWFSKDRYSLFDNGMHYVVVRISNLAPSDAGRYHCGVRGEEPVQSEVNLEVKNDLFTCGKTLMRTAYTGESMNITCPYLSTHTQAAKYLCKSFRTQGCDYRVSAQEDRTWVHLDRVSLYDDREKHVFTAMLGNLRKLDLGSYWCGVETGWEHGGNDGYKALIQKVQLTMADTRPTSPPTTPPHTTEATGPKTTPTKPLPTSTELDTTQPTETSRPLPIRTDTTIHARGQDSPKPYTELFSTAIPFVKSFSSLWLMVIYAILALMAVVLLTALLYVITRRRRAKEIDSSYSLVAMDTLWTHLEHPMDLVGSDLSEAVPSESN